MELMIVSLQAKNQQLESKNQQLEEEISQLGDTYLYEYQELVAHDVAFYDIYMT